MNIGGIVRPQCCLAVGEGKVGGGGSERKECHPMAPVAYGEGKSAALDRAALCCARLRIAAYSAPQQTLLAGIGFYGQYWPWQCCVYCANPGTLSRAEPSRVAPSGIDLSLLSSLRS